MTVELTLLTLATLLQAIYFAVYSISACLQIGTKTAMGPRDTPVQLTGLAGRAQRALGNQFEALILFAIAILVLTFSDQTDGHTAIAAALFLIARVLYLPAYLFGLPPWRTVIWTIGFTATLVLLFKALI
jgi:uncharacterized MAPEG superfamily protein